MVDHPIFGLIKQIPDDAAQREAIAYMNFKGITTVEGLTAYTTDQLKRDEVSEPTVGFLEGILQKAYNIMFKPPEEVQYLDHGMEDHGDYLVVNGNKINIPRRGKGREKTEIIAIYQSHYGGANTSGILEQLGGNLTRPTVVKYLSEAGLYTPGQKSPAATIEPRTCAGGSSRPPLRASGAPPQSPLEKLVQWHP